MPNNFFITGAAYTSKAGSDSNAGAANTPKATITGAVALNAIGNVVVGTGSYTEGLTGIIGSNITSITADGNVVVYGDNTMAWSPTGANAFKIVGISFRGLASVTGVSGSAVTRFEDCIFSSISNFSASIGGIYVRCIFVNCNWAGTNATRYTFEQCIFINCSIRDCTRMVYSYINGASSLRTAAGISAANFDNNNLMGTIAVGDTNYQALAAHRTSWPALNVNSFTLAPKFNNVEKMDFTLAFDSPHIKVDGTNIGGTNTATPSTVLDAEWQSVNGAIWSGVEMSGTDLVLSAGQTVGTITSAPIRIAANTSEIQNLQYNGLLLFNKSTAGGSTTNLNVPDTTVYAGNDASGMGNPDRLTIEMRWSGADAQPSSSAQWLNGNLLPAGNYGIFCINRKPTVDNTGKANGEAGYSNTSVNPVYAQWVQFRVTLRNNYV